MTYSHDQLLPIAPLDFNAGTFEHFAGFVASPEGLQAHNKQQTRLRHNLVLVHVLRGLTAEDFPRLVEFPLTTISAHFFPVN